MKIALKYGLLITAAVIAWVVVVRLFLGIGADSKANIIAPILFNITTIAAIFLGMSSRKKEMGGDLSFREGIKVGMAISLVYALSACLFFFVQFLIAGPKLLLSEAGEQTTPLWQVAVMAYAGLFFGSLVFGLIYSTIIAFFIARRRSQESSEII